MAGVVDEQQSQRAIIGGDTADYGSIFSSLTGIETGGVDLFVVVPVVAVGGHIALGGGVGDCCVG